MGYSREIYQQAQRILAARRQRAEQNAAALHERIARRRPELAELERQLAATSVAVARIFMEGTQVPERIAAQRDKSLALQQKITDLLHREGEQADNFEPQYTCPRCRDTGHLPGGLCTCMTELMQALACEQICLQGKMKLTDFADVREDYYPDTPDASGIIPRERMHSVIDYCRTYAEEFDASSPNLLLCGYTGTGKTFLSLAIAREVIRRGFSVIYAPVQQLLSRLEKEHFGRSDEDSMQPLTDCDLLIIDDLGTEFTSPFYISCLYQIVNTRALEGKPCIISTNLSHSELLERYGEQLASRLTGLYVPLLFFGRDIRQIMLDAQW
ncbi:MAG: ATP-binding protein [Clostridia bacterium]|nr:ATP-binding protein [Clostridia bacterium]